jgi:hypothetical protein
VFAPLLAQEETQPEIRPWKLDMRRFSYAKIVAAEAAPVT